jgi:uncharacterized cupin superfamily protein
MPFSRVEVAMQSVNIVSVDKPEGRLDVAGLLGSSGLEMFVYDLEPGRSSSPYHYEYEEEWLLVIDGAVAVRDPEGEHLLSPGDIVCFPPGPDGAHKVINHSDASAHVIMFSSSREPAVAVYPDSDKIGVWPGNPQDHVMLRRSDGHVGYYEGE